ncbi:MAG: hypothetical protein WD379_04260 [Dehalococcoidia bacterium]
MPSLGLAKDASSRSLRCGDTPLSDTLLKDCAKEYTTENAYKADADRNDGGRHPILTSLIRL